MLLRLIILSFLSLKCVHCISKEGLIRNRLLSDYDHLTVPINSSQRAVNISFGLAIYQIIDFEAKSEILGLMTWIRMVWNDYRLSREHSNLSDIGDISDIGVIRFSERQIWRPDILPYNDVGSYHPSKYTDVIPVKVSRDGTVEWLKPAALDSACAMDVTKFPFDTQYCNLSFGSWQYKADEVDIYCGTPDKYEFATDTEWKILDIGCSRTEETFPSGSYSYITIQIHLERLNEFYFHNMILPNSVLLSLSCLIFFLPSDTGERSSYGITVMMSLTLNLMMVLNIVPESSKTFPRVCRYFLCSIYICGGALFFTTLSPYVWKFGFYLSRRFAKRGTVFSIDHDHASWCPVSDKICGILYLVATCIFSITFIQSLK